MAKGIEMNGMLRGKRGGVVYSRSNGEQISRVRVTQIANPKTTKQQAQRCIFATATAAYSKMKAICDHSFEGVKYGAKSQQAFMKENLALMRNRAAADEGNFLIPNISVLMANPYLISKGSLNSLNHVDYSRLDSGIKLINGSYTENNPLTAGEYKNTMGINFGDQITVVAIIDKGGDPVGSYAGREYRNFKFVYCRITLKDNAQASDIVLNENDFGNAVIVENIAGPDSISQESFTFTTSNNELKIVVSERHDSVLAAAVIHSAKEGDKWLRSTEHLHLNEEMLVFNFNDILPAWQEGTTPLQVGSERYLNNAEQELVVETPDLDSRLVATINTSTSETGVRKLAVIDSGQYAGFVMVDDLDNKAPYTPVDGGWQKVENVQPTNASNIITLALATRVIGYAPTIVTGD